MNHHHEQDKPRRRSSYTIGDGAPSHGEDYPFVDRDDRRYSPGDAEPPYEEAGESYADFLPSWSPSHGDDQAQRNRFSRYPYSVEGDSADYGGDSGHTPGPDQLPEADHSPRPERERRSYNPWADGEYARWYPSNPPPESRPADTHRNPDSSATQDERPKSSPTPPIPRWRSIASAHSFDPNGPSSHGEPPHTANGATGNSFRRGEATGDNAGRDTRYAREGFGHGAPSFGPSRGDSAPPFGPSRGDSAPPFGPSRGDSAPPFGPPPGAGAPAYGPTAPQGAVMSRPLYPQHQLMDAKKSVAEKIDVVRRGKWYILVVFLVVMGGVVAYTETATPTFEAYSLLLIDTRQTPATTGAVDLMNEPALNSRKLPNQALILGQSLLIAERTAERLIEMKIVPDTGDRLSVLGEAGRQADARHIAERLQKDYVVVQPASDMEDADGIRVTSKGPIAAEAALIANLYAEEYVDLAKETSERDVVAARDYLEEQVNQKREELYALEAQIEDYVSTEGALSTGNDAPRITEQIAQLEADLDAARIEQSMKQASVSSLEHELSQLQPRMVDRVASGVDQEIQQAQTEIADLEARLEKIYQNYPELREHPEDNPSLRTMLERLQSLRTRVRDLSEKYVDEVYASGGVNPGQQQSGTSYIAELRRTLATERVALSGATARVEATQQRLADYRKRLQSIPMQTNDLEKLRRDKESIEKQYLGFVEQLQQVRIKAEATQSFAQIIRPASVPESPVSPRKAVNLSLGAILGLLLGLGSAFARYKLDTRIYTPDDLRQRELPLLGVVPDMSATIQRELGRGAMAGGGAGIVNASLVAYLSPLSPEAEAYRRLLANLQFKGIRSDVGSVLVTSSEMGAGKTVTALNLAITAAQSGRKTLILDADMHRPSLHMNLGFSQDPRRTRQLFEGRVPIRLAELKTGINSLYALSLRDLIAVPGELLASHEMRSLLYRLKQAFDLIIFDSPPVLAASDASILAAQADATILVTSAGHTQTEDLDSAVEELRGIGARIFGTVLNRFDPSQGGGRYPGYAGYPGRQSRRRLFF